MHCLSNIMIDNVLAGIITSSQAITLFLMMGTIAAMLIATRRRMREARNSPQAYAREQVRRIREEREVGNQISQAMVEMEEVARHVNAQIDTKLVKLETLIRHADERIAALESMRDACGEHPGMDSTDVPVSSTTTVQSNPSASIKTLVFQLADQGLSTSEIAREVNRPIGEVELFLRLRPVIDQKI